MLNAVDKYEKFLPFISAKVTAAARCFSASITSIFPRFSRHGISTGQLKSPRLNPLEGSTLDLAISSSPATSKSEKSDAEVEVLSLLLESAHVYIYTRVTYHVTRSKSKRSWRMFTQSAINNALC